MSSEKTPYPVQPAPLMPPPQPNQYDAPPTANYNPQQNYPPNYTQPGHVQPAVMHTGYMHPAVIVAGVPPLSHSPQHLSKCFKI